MERQVVVVAALLALLLAVLALLTGLAGSSQFGDARTGGLIEGPLVRAVQGDDGPAEAAEPLPEVRPPRWLPVLLVLLVSILVALVVRALRRVVRSGADDPGEPPPVGDAAGDPGAVVLDELRIAARSAAEELRRDGTGVADTVVRCWERLEELGGRLGTPRPEHETPTEFGADLLRRNGADPVAVDELLHLYHRARFGRVAVPAADGEKAAQALGRVADTLRTADEVHVAGGGGRG